MSYIDGFIERLNIIPSEVLGVLQCIRKKDIAYEGVQSEVRRMREDLLARVNQADEMRKTHSFVGSQYREMLRKEKQLRELAQEKIDLAEELYELVHELTEELESQLGEEDEDQKKSKRRKKELLEESQPVYCYCKQQSFGKMVMCENKKCDIQWFHRECIPIKKLPQSWYCRHCAPE